MYIINDVAYADEYNNNNLKIVKIHIISELCMLVTFSNGEKRIFDAEYLIKIPVYSKLNDYNVFKKAYIENGIIVWDNGNIDIGVEEVYKKSYVYERKEVI